MSSTSDEEKVEQKQPGCFEYLIICFFFLATPATFFVLQGFFNKETLLNAWVFAYFINLGIIFLLVPWVVYNECFKDVMPNSAQQIEWPTKKKLKFALYVILIWVASTIMFSIPMGIMHLGISFGSEIKLGNNLVPSEKMKSK